MPTAAELAGLRPPAGIDGISILPTLLGPKGAGRGQRKHEFLYWELPRRDPKSRWAYCKEIPTQALRMGEWKLIRPQPGGPVELYNLAEDVGETRDLTPRKPAALAKMQQYLRTARTEPRPPVPFHDEWRTG